MSIAKHTPGPWAYSIYPQPNGCPIVGTKGLMVAMLAHSVNEPEQKETALANARLIAAAPDLLAWAQKHAFNTHRGTLTVDIVDVIELQNIIHRINP